MERHRKLGEITVFFAVLHYLNVFWWTVLPYIVYITFNDFERKAMTSLDPHNLIKSMAGLMTLT